MPTTPAPTFDAHRVLPRLKTPAFLHAVADIPAAQRPLTRPWAGPLHVAYALDDGEAYRFVSAQMARDAQLTPDALHALALSNLPAAARAAGRDIVQAGALRRLTAGDGLAAACLLDEALWDEVLANCDGRAIFIAPHRDLLYFGPLQQDAIAAVDAILAAADWHDTHALLPLLLLRQGGQWQAFERGSGP